MTMMVSNVARELEGKGMYINLGAYAGTPKGRVTRYVLNDVSCTL